MSDGQTGGGVNTILAALVALLVGFIGGYLVGQNGGAGGLPATANVARPANNGCPHTLEEKDIYILAGFRCPGTPDAQALLTDCHCPVAHGLMDRVKSELAAGKDGLQIREEIEAEYGDRLKFAGQ